MQNHTEVNYKIKDLNVSSKYIIKCYQRKLIQLNAIMI